MLTQSPWRHRLAIPVMVLISLALAGPCPGQEQRERRRGDRPRWEQMTEEQRSAFRERMQERRAQFQRDRAERLRTMLDLDKAEFAVLEPRIQAVQEKVRERAMIGRQGRRDRREPRGRRPDAGAPFDRGDGAPSEQGRKLTEAAARLRSTLENDDASTQDIRAALASLRKARAAMDASIAEAREDLRGLLTAKQEAALVMADVLD